MPQFPMREHDIRGCPRGQAWILKRRERKKGKPAEGPGASQPPGINAKGPPAANGEPFHYSDARPGQ